VRRWVEHAGELELDVRAPTVQAVFAEASLALAEVLGEKGPGPAVERRLRVEAPDTPALLAGWLEELVWLAEHEALIAERVATMSVCGGVADGRVVTRAGRPRGLVKAVTYHGLACERHGGEWHATVVLDV
jgi:SHS2 domain-containing protein